MEHIIRSIGIRPLARALGLSPGSVQRWKVQIPIDRVSAIEATYGFPAEDQRPDVRWVRVEDRSWKHHPKGRPMVDPDDVLGRQS